MDVTCPVISFSAFRSLCTHARDCVFLKKILNALRLVGVHNDMHFRHSACVYADIMIHE